MKRSIQQQPQLLLGRELRTVTQQQRHRRLLLKQPPHQSVSCFVQPPPLRHLDLPTKQKKLQQNSILRSKDINNSDRICCSYYNLKQDVGYNHDYFCYSTTGRRYTTQQHRSFSLLSRSLSASTTTTTAAISASTSKNCRKFSTSNNDYDDEDELSFMIRRREQQESGGGQPSLLSYDTDEKNIHKVHVTMMEEMDIHALNRKHRHVRLIRDPPPPTTTTLLKATKNKNATAQTATTTFEQLELQQLQLQELQNRHYTTAQTIVQIGNDLLSPPILDPVPGWGSSTTTSQPTNNQHHSSSNRNMNVSEMSLTNKKTDETKNYSHVLRHITSFTHSYITLINHYRLYHNTATNYYSNMWQSLDYRRTSYTAMNVSMDLLLHIVQQKVWYHQQLLEQQLLQKEEERRKIDSEEELLQYGVNIQEAYIIDRNTSNSRNSDNKNIPPSSVMGNEHKDDTDDDKNDVNRISNNDTMWLYKPGIIYNPLMQIWKHASLVAQQQYQTSVHPLGMVTSINGRLVAPEVAATLIVPPSNTTTTTSATTGTAATLGNNNDSNVNNRGNLRTAKQVMGHFQQIILAAIEYTHYTRPLILYPKRQSNNYRRVPYKLFYNSTTFNMMLEVYMYQYFQDPIQPETKKKQKKVIKTDVNDPWAIYRNIEKPPDPAAAVMQNAFLAINTAIRKLMEQYNPKKDNSPKKIAILEEVVNNYHLYLEEMQRRQYTVPVQPKQPIWQDDIEDAKIVEDEKALRDAALAGQYDKDGNVVVLEPKDAIPVTYTHANPTTITPVDVTGMGLVFRPDVETYNLFMKTWALKSPDVKFADVQVHRIYKDMQREGFDLSPTNETYNVLFHFYASHPEKFVHIVERRIQYLIEKHGIRNVQLMHWYYAIETFTSVKIHRYKAKEYFENMLYSSHHHTFVPKKKRYGDNDPYAKVNIIAEDDDDLQSIALIQRAAQLIMNMYRTEIKHHIDVINHTNKYVHDSKQTNTTIKNSKAEINIALKSSFDLYIKLKETGFLDFSGEERDEDGYLQYRDEIRTTFMDIYAYAGQMDNAMKIFHRIVRTNIGHYMSLIDAYGKHDNVDGAESIYERMIHDPNIKQLNCDVFTILMNGYAQSSYYSPNELSDSIVGVLQRMRTEPKCTEYNIRPDTKTYNELLYRLYDIQIGKSLKNDERFLKAVSILDEMEQYRERDTPSNIEPLVRPNINTYLKIVQIGLTVEDFDGVFKIVHRMAMTPISDATPTKRFLNSESNHSIFHMYREVNTFEAVDYMIKLMNTLTQWADEKQTLLRPTAGTYSVLFKACSGLKKSMSSRSSSKCNPDDILQTLYEQMKSANIKPNHSTYTELIEYYTQSEKGHDLDRARDLLVELEEKNDPMMKSDKRMYDAIFFAYLNMGDIAAAVQILFRYTKQYLAFKVDDRPSGLLYQTLVKHCIQSDELIKGALFIDQLHILQRDEPLLDVVQGLTIQIDSKGVPHHLGPDVVTIDKLIKAIKKSTSIAASDQQFYKRLLTKHNDAIKRFHRRRIRIKKKAFLYT